MLTNPRAELGLRVLPTYIGSIWRCGKVDDRSQGNDAGGINLFVGHVIMALDMINTDRFGNARLLIEIEQVTLQARVIDDPAKIAFEMTVINDVEADQRAKQPPIGFDNPFSEQIAAAR